MIPLNYLSLLKEIRASAESTVREKLKTYAKHWLFYM